MAWSPSERDVEGAAAGGPDVGRIAKRSFIAGAAIVLPLAVTIFVVSFLPQFVDNSLDPDADSFQEVKLVEFPVEGGAHEPSGGRQESGATADDRVAEYDDVSPGHAGRDGAPRGCADGPPAERTRREEATRKPAEGTPAERAEGEDG